MAGSIDVIRMIKVIDSVGHSLHEGKILDRMNCDLANEIIDMVDSIRIKGKCIAMYELYCHHPVFLLLLVLLILVCFLCVSCQIIIHGEIGIIILSILMS